MEISLTTPALLFPAIALLLVAYTNRYLAIARLMRDLKEAWKKEQNTSAIRQLKLLRRRERYIRQMQALGIASMFCCALSMAFFYANKPSAGSAMFGLALLLMIGSLAFSLRDIFLAGGALRIEMEDLEREFVDR